MGMDFMAGKRQWESGCGEERGLVRIWLVG